MRKLSWEPSYEDGHRYLWNERLKVPYLHLLRPENKSVCVYTTAKVIFITLKNCQTNDLQDVTQKCTVLFMWKWIWCF